MNDDNKNCNKIRYQLKNMIDPILDGPLKKYEQQLLSFFINTARITSLDHTITEIFGYMQIYESLTQETLRALTQTTSLENSKNQKSKQKPFSTSTISTTLRGLIQGKILVRGHIPSTHKYSYKLKSPDINFIYQDFSLIAQDLEDFDDYLVELQEQISGHLKLYPNEAQFFLLRINGIRNYIEVQRRTIKEQAKFDFFPENIQSLKQAKELIIFPPDLLPLESQMVSFIVDNNIFIGNDPVLNRIFAYMQTRQIVTQNLIEQLCPLSLSTISRKLNQLMELDMIGGHPKEYQKSRKYYIDSISSTLIQMIIDSDYYIYSWVDKFNGLREDLTTRKEDLQNLPGYSHLIRKISQILKKIEAFRYETQKLEKNFADLTRFLQQESPKSKS